MLTWETIFPQVVQNWRSRKWLFNHSLSFLKYHVPLFCFLLLPINDNHKMENFSTSTIHLQSIMQKIHSPGYTPVFCYTTFSSLLPPTATLWCLIYRISLAWDCKTLEAETLSFCMFVKWCFFSWASFLFHLSNTTEFYCLSDRKSYFKNVFIPLWVLKFQYQQDNMFYKWHKCWLVISCVNWQYLPSVGSAICVISHWLVTYSW